MKYDIMHKQYMIDKQHKDTIMVVKKAKEELLVFKAAKSQEDIGSTLESLSKAMSKLKLKEGGIKTLKKNLDEKESKIVSLNEVVEKRTL